MSKAQKYHTSIDPQKLEAILSGLANGQPLRQLCRQEGFPAASTIVELAQRDSAFGERYARARSIGCDVIFEEILEISDNGSNDWIDRETESGRVEQVLNHEHIQRSKLRVDARKWMLSKMRPDKYSDKQLVETSGPNGGPQEHQVLHRLDFTSSS